MDRHQILAERITRVLEQLTRLEQALDSAELVTVSRGAETPTKLLGEIRAHTWLLRALLDSAGPAAGAPAGGQPQADALDSLRREWEQINA